MWKTLFTGGFDSRASLAIQFATGIIVVIVMVVNLVKDRFK